MKEVEEEADECLYWLELMIESGLTTSEATIELSREADEITAMVVASVRSAKKAR